MITGVKGFDLSFASTIHTERQFIFSIIIGNYNNVAWLKLLLSLGIKWVSYKYAIIYDHGPERFTFRLRRDILELVNGGRKKFLRLLSIFVLSGMAGIAKGWCKMSWQQAQKPSETTEKVHSILQI